MRSMRLWMLGGMLAAAVLLVGGLRVAPAQNAAAAPKTTGYALKKPVFGGACPTCPWGAMADVVKADAGLRGPDIGFAGVLDRDGHGAIAPRHIGIMRLNPADQARFQRSA